MQKSKSFFDIYPIIDTSFGNPIFHQSQAFILHPFSHLLTIQSAQNGVVSPIQFSQNLSPPSNNSSQISLQNINMNTSNKQSYSPEQYQYQAENQITPNTQSSLIKQEENMIQSSQQIIDIQQPNKHIQTNSLFHSLSPIHIYPTNQYSDKLSIGSSKNEPMSIQIPDSIIILNPHIDGIEANEQQNDIKGYTDINNGENQTKKMINISLNQKEQLFNSKPNTSISRIQQFQNDSNIQRNIEQKNEKLVKKEEIINDPKDWRLKWKPFAYQNRNKISDFIQDDITQKQNQNTSSSQYDSQSQYKDSQNRQWIQNYGKEQQQSHLENKKDKEDIQKQSQIKKQINNDQTQQQRYKQEQLSRLVHKKERKRSLNDISLSNLLAMSYNEIKQINDEEMLSKSKRKELKTIWNRRNGRQSAPPQDIINNNQMKDNLKQKHKSKDRSIERRKEKKKKKKEGKEAKIENNKQKEKIIEKEMEKRLEQENEGKIRSEISSLITDSPKDMRFDIALQSINSSQSQENVSINSGTYINTQSGDKYQFIERQLSEEEKKTEKQKNNDIEQEKKLKKIQLKQEQKELEFEEKDIKMSFLTISRQRDHKKHTEDQEKDHSIERKRKDKHSKTEKTSLEEKEKYLKDNYEEDKHEKKHKQKDHEKQHKKSKDKKKKKDDNY